MSASHFSRGELAKMIGLRLGSALVVLAAAFFLPAGTFDYWEAWVYIALLLVPAVFLMGYLARNDPALMERRTRMKERELQQRRIISLSIVWFLAMFLVPGFDRRFEWSDVPVWLVIAADLVIALGYPLVFLVYRENTYASRVIEVADDICVTTGVTEGLQMLLNASLDPKDQLLIPGPTYPQYNVITKFADAEPPLSLY